jgi:hypothetical protein
MSARPASAEEPESSLSERDLAILAFEREWWRHAGAKEEAIRAQFGLSAARYYQLLNILIDSPDAVRHDPMLVRRLQRGRDARTRARASRVFTVHDQGADDRRPPTTKP